jgi:opacity protein-like surface antigen
MSRTTTNVFVATLIAVFAGQALAADVAQPKSREQVQAELSEAIRTGNILDNVTSQMLKDAYPERYSNQATAQAKANDDKAAVAQANVTRR